jgi:hypothetical protein
MKLTVGYTIYNKEHLIPKIIGSLGWLEDGDELIFLLDSCKDSSLKELLRLKKVLPVYFVEGQYLRRAAIKGWLNNTKDSIFTFFRNVIK